MISTVKFPLKNLFKRYNLFENWQSYTVEKLLPCEYYILHHKELPPKEFFP